MIDKCRFVSILIKAMKPYYVTFEQNEIQDNVLTEVLKR